MKRYEEIGNFWNERGMGKTKESTNEREERQSVEAARRQENQQPGEKLISQQRLVQATRYREY